MTRIDAYRHMLEGRLVQHPMLPGSVWKIDTDRKIKIDGLTVDWGQDFFALNHLSDEWGLYDQS